MLFWALILLDVLLWIEVARMHYQAHQRNKMRDEEIQRHREGNW